MVWSSGITRESVSLPGLAPVTAGPFPRTGGTGRRVGYSYSYGSEPRKLSLTHCNYYNYSKEPWIFYALVLLRIRLPTVGFLNKTRIGWVWPGSNNHMINKELLIYGMDLAKGKRVAGPDWQVR